MAHDTHAATDHHDGEAHPHPALPPVTDEAPDSPMWLPAAGLALLTILVLFALFRAASGGDEAVEGEAVEGEVVEGEVVEGEAAAGEAAPAVIRAGEPGAVPAPAAPH